eukprot:RCo003163
MTCWSRSRKLSSPSPPAGCSKHKLIFSTMICLGILLKKGELDVNHVTFLLRGPKKQSERAAERPDTVQEWLPEASWVAVQALAEVQGTTPAFDTLPADVCDGKRWKDWCESEKPEEEKMP